MAFLGKMAGGAGQNIIKRRAPRMDPPYILIDLLVLGPFPFDLTTR